MSDPDDILNESVFKELEEIADGLEPNNAYIISIKDFNGPNNAEKVSEFNQILSKFTHDLISGGFLNNLYPGSQVLVNFAISECCCDDEDCNITRFLCTIYQGDDIDDKLLPEPPSNIVLH